MKTVRMTNRLKMSLVAATGVFFMSLMLLLTVASPARAGESNFCWGVTLAAYNQPGYGCEDSVSRYITGVYGQGTQGHVCAGRGGVYMTCSNDRSYGAYSGFDGTQSFRAFIYNNHNAANKVYGHTWWNDAPPPPSPPPPPPPLTVTGNPAAVVDPVNGLTSLWRGSDGKLYETLAVRGQWTTFSPTWTWQDATVASDPAVVIDPVNGLAAIWRGSDGRLYETLSVNGQWTTFSPTWNWGGGGVTVTGNPAVVIDPVNGLAAIWRGSDGKLYETVSVNGVWTTFSPTWTWGGATVTGDPAVVIDPVNGLTALWRGSDGRLYETLAVRGQWTTFSPTWGWQGGGVTVASSPAMVVDPTNGITAQWRGSDNKLYETLAVRGQWTTFSPTWTWGGATVASDPAVVVDPTNGITSLWRGSDGRLYETLAVRGQWTTFSPTWNNW